MTRFKAVIISVFIAVLIAVAYFALRLGLLGVRFADEGTTTPEGIRLVTQVEGVEKINKDAEAVFALFGTNEIGLFESIPNEKNFLIISDLKSKLGSYSEVVMDKTLQLRGDPVAIRIRFGSHFKLKFLYIFDPRKSFDGAQMTNLGPHYTLIATNIFIYSDYLGP